MKFSERELICFNSILDGNHIFGARCSVSKNPGPDYINATIKDLREHGLLTKEDKVNESFASVVKTLEAYKNADQYLMINHMKVGLLKNKTYLVFLAKDEEGYELTAMNKSLFLYQFMKLTPLIAEKDSGAKALSQKMTLLKWQEEFCEQRVENFMCIQSVAKQEFGETELFYRIGKQGFIYELQNEELIECGSLKMRHRLMEIFEMDVRQEVV